MEDKIVNLKVVPHTSIDPTEDGILQSIADFLKENGILDEWSEDDVELEDASSDETKVGDLNAFERQFFIVGQVLGEIIKEELIEFEAANSDKITAIMREQKVTMTEAASIFSQDRESYLSDEQRILLNQCSFTMTNALTLYEWSVRMRYNQWGQAIIVRKGFTAYCYG